MSNEIILSSNSETLRELLGNNGKKYFVPRFQRDYSWEEDNWELFWEDIENIAEGHNQYHYMGYLVLQKADASTSKIIDGQQRLTTFSLLVLAAIKRLEEAGNEQERIDELHKNFIGSKDLIKLRTTNKLRLNRNNDYYYNEAVIGNSLPRRKVKRTVRLMGQALEYFYKVLDNKTGEDIGRIIETVSQNMLFTTIYITDELNAYKIFETLNARGSQLSSGDLLKNYLFSLIDKDNSDTPDEVIDRLEEKWVQIGADIGDRHYTDYILCDWNSGHKLSRKASLFKSIRDKLKTPKQADDYLDKLARNSQLYAALLNAEDEFWKDHHEYRSIKRSLYFLQSFHIRQPVSLLFKAYLEYPEDFAKILRWVVNFSLRYNVICRGHTGDQEKLYNKICHTLAGGKNDVAAIKEALHELYPDDTKFRQAFTDKTMPTAQSNKRVRYLLARMAEASPYAIDETTLTVEHILPENPRDEWCSHFGDNWRFFTQRIGNMALVTKTENKELGQKAFAEKKDVLLQSECDINHDVGDYSEWSSRSVESRQKNMAERAVRLWRID